MIKRKKMGFHRLRSQIIRKLLLSSLIALIIRIIGSMLIFAFTSNTLEIMEFTDYVAENLHKEVDNINEVKNWSGWNSINSEWNIIVFDSQDNIVYTTKETDNIILYDLILINTRIKKLEARLAINYQPSEMTKFYFSILSIVDWFLLFIIFALLFRKIEKYTYEISDGISILAGGEINHKIPIKDKSELAMIAMNINRMAEALHNRMEEKKRSDKERDDLITNLAHDIRTPITILEGYLSMLVNDNSVSKKKQKEYLEISLNKSHELSRRADNIFEYVRLNNKREELGCTLMYAKSYVINQFEEMTMILAREGFKFDVDIELDQDYNINIDRVITQRVFDNLLSNIIKYADKNHPIYLKANIQDENVVISIKNKSKEKITMETERLFDRTVSGDLSRNGKSEGLGLSICKLIMEMQGGKISAEVSDDFIEFTLKFLK